MPIVRDRTGLLRIGGLSLSELVREMNTPAYVYDVDAMTAEALALESSFDGAPHLVAYAMKANSAGGVVRALTGAGCGVDIVSGAELRLARSCDVPPERIVFSGVAKDEAEIDLAIGTGPQGIGAIQIESVEEVARVAARARALGRTARVSLRVNPSVDLTGATHKNIATGHDAAKFGVPREDAVRAVALVEQSPELRLVGMAAHAGSQFMSTSPYLESARVLFGLVRGLREEGRARSLAYVNSGGGFGVDYAAAVPAPEGTGGRAAAERPARPLPADFVRAVQAEQRAAGLGELALYVEPGRSLVAPHGVLLARVIQAKIAAHRRWLMIDAGMNDLLRPALYQALHRIVPIQTTLAEATASWRVVGPVCESSDDFGDHELPLDPPREVAILDAGAYGYVMASVYNGRQLPVEVFVRGGRVASHTARASTDAWVAERARAGG
ncbi:MAG TPA: diaminopimelate decarboxylase [Polyangiaceae bacterium]|jgi:diaminopimelate decarboxylase|nr:diaminopimelate decarboxylase [Polyangiaceae bacterium]